MTNVNEAATLALVTSLIGYLAMSLGGGLGMYFGVGGAFEYLYYRRRRADAECWKCQPRRWAAPALRRRELLLGTSNLTIASLASGVLAHDIATTNHTAVYFGGAHGVAFSIAVTVFYFLATDCGLYWAHRIFHHPVLFRSIHKTHHRNNTPSAFTSAAVHPVEFFIYQGIMMAPVFVLPLPVVGLIVVLVYQHWVALVDHSGVRLRSHLPWQPPPQFHDDHHAYFHVNYGQNLGLWDRIFGTWRRVGRRYGVEVFGGRGAPVDGAREVGLIDYGDGGERPREELAS